jgi:cytochrome c oxidase subunit 1
VVGHFHYIVMGAITFAGMAGLYYWFPLFAGRWYQERLAKVHFWLWMVGTNVTFFAMVLLGYGGMPRRYATYLPQFITLHQIATFGAFLLLIGGFLWVYNFVVSWLEGPKVDDGDPWNLADRDLNTAEWDWFETELKTAIPDGGDDGDGETVLPDGGEPDADDETAD